MMHSCQYLKELVRIHMFKINAVKGGKRYRIPMLLFEAIRCDLKPIETKGILC
jgi:hypothetical protein